MGKPNLRQRFWWWFVDDVLKYDKGKMLNLPLKVLHFFLFPLLTIYWEMQKHHGYQPQSYVWTIYGIKYHDDLFRHFAFGGDELFKIVKRADGLVTIEKQVDKKDGA